MEAEEARSNSAKEDGPKRPILEFAYARLARRAHSEGELSRKMRRAGYPDDAVTDVLERLRSLKYLDDEAFAQDFARAATERRLWGPARIAHRLRDRGVAEPVIDRAIADAFELGESAAAARALSRFHRVYNHKGSPEQRKSRAYRHLLSRGYSAEVAYEAVASNGDPMSPSGEESSEGVNPDP